MIQGQVPSDEEDTGSRKAARRASGEAPRQGALPGIPMDGKNVRGASRRTVGGRRMLVTAVEHS